MLCVAELWRNVLFWLLSCIKCWEKTLETSEERASIRWHWEKIEGCFFFKFRGFRTFLLLSKDQ